MTAETQRTTGRTHWTNYEVTFYYGEHRTTATDRVKVTEGRESLTDLPELIARTHRESYPDPDKIAIVGIEVLCSSRIDLLGPWLDEIANARTPRTLRAITDAATTARMIGPRARRADAEVITRRLGEREAELAALPANHAAS